LVETKKGNNKMDTTNFFGGVQYEFVPTNDSAIIAIDKEIAKL
jgi:hypothetical protein